MVGYLLLGFGCFIGCIAYKRIKELKRISKRKDKLEKRIDKL